jgi:hypothetical protein
MSNPELFAVIVNCLLILQGAVVTGATVMSLLAYRKHSALKHIIAVSYAHLMLIFVSAYNIYLEATPLWSWRALLLLSTYVVSDYSLYVLLKRGHYVDFYERLKAEGYIAEQPKAIDLSVKNGE